MNSSRTAFPLYGSKCHQKTLLLSHLLHLLSKRKEYVTEERDGTGSWTLTTENNPSYQRESVESDQG